MRELHARSDESKDVATTSLLESYIDEAEGRTWLLSETPRSPDSPEVL